MNTKISNIFYKEIIKRHIDTTQYTVSSVVPTNYNLYDTVVVYVVDSEWRVIKLSDMIKACILYDKKTIDDKIEDVSIIVDPISLNACMYSGIVKIKDIDENNRLVLEVDKQIFLMGMRYSTLDGANNNIKLERYQVQIMQLRDVFIFKSDPKYIVINTKLKDIIPVNYYIDKLDYNKNPIISTFHPKTLIYVIQYKSSSGKYKTTILVGTGASSEKQTGFNYKNANFDDYFKLYIDTLEEKNAFIFPMFWYCANNIYKKSKIITL
jgi:hypothetical protein